MRINVYAEEITGECAVVTKEVFDETFGMRTFYGIRMYLASPDVLHHGPNDDDRSAITFWVPWTRTNGNYFPPIKELFATLRAATTDAEANDLAERIRRIENQSNQKAAMTPERPSMGEYSSGPTRSREATPFA